LFPRFHPHHFQVAVEDWNALEAAKGARGRVGAPRDRPPRILGGEHNGVGGGGGGGGGKNAVATSLQLRLSCRALPSKDTLSQADPFVTVAVFDAALNDFAVVERTEVVKNDRDAMFKKQMHIRLPPATMAAASAAADAANATPASIGNNDNGNGNNNYNGKAGMLRLRVYDCEGGDAGRSESERYLIGTVDVDVRGK
jgi:hypothetical protein